MAAAGPKGRRKKFFGPPTDESGQPAGGGRVITTLKSNFFEFEKRDKTRLLQLLL